jgi:hypothetical protein
MNTVAAVLGAAVVLFAQTPRLDTSTKALVTAASEYVGAYNPKMQDVLADELAVQRVIGLGGADLQSRTTRADFFLTYLQADTTFIAVRDVREVDGAAVDDPDNVRMLMARAPLWRLGSVIADKNSRFNIGAITRTFNEPTLALLIMTAKHRGRFKFERIGLATGPGTRVILSFKEHDRPTLVSGTNGVPVFSAGDLVVDAATGRIEQTTIHFVFNSVTARIETEYAEDARLKLWVPSVMRETYQQTAKGFEQTIKCVSTYTNYRKFETSAIIK